MKHTKILYITQLLLFLVYVFIHFCTDLKFFLLPVSYLLIGLILIISVVVLFFKKKKLQELLQIIYIGNIILITSATAGYYFFNAKKAHKKFHIVKIEKSVKEKQFKTKIDSLLGKPYFVRWGNSQFEAYYKTKYEIDYIHYLVTYSTKDSIFQNIHAF